MSGIHFAALTTPSIARQEVNRPRNSKRRRVSLACERCRIRKSRVRDTRLASVRLELTFMLN